MNRWTGFSNRLESLPIVFIAVTLVAIWYSSALYIDYQYRGYSLPWSQALILALADWWPWVVLAPFILFLGRRYSFERSGGWTPLLVHLPASVLCAFAKTLIEMMARKHFLGGPDLMAGGFVALSQECLIYWAFIALVHGIEYRRRYRERELRASQLEAQLARAHLDALKTQLHPHFLFNTLHAISTLMHRDVEAADCMMSRLSDLLRISLDRDGAHTVPLREELDFLRRYLEIEEVRFGNRLSFELDIAPETLDVQVPNLILQPLAENAVRHGVCRRSGGGRVTVRSRMENRHLALEVMDNGPGIPDESPAFADHGVGLTNTRERLRQLYGDRQELTLENGSVEGLRVRMRIPIQDRGTNGEDG